MYFAFCVRSFFSAQKKHDRRGILGPFYSQEKQQTTTLGIKPLLTKTIDFASPRLTICSMSEVLLFLP